MDDEYGLGELAPHFEVALNPLHQIAIIAAAVLGRAREIGVYDPALPPMGYLEAPDTEKMTSRRIPRTAGSRLRRSGPP